MKAVKIRDNIYWVGGLDWDVRNFHGYLTPRGTTYNAYLIIDEKVTLIDTVKHYCFDEMMDRIASVIDPTKIDNIISNHVEMDHSGGLPRLMEMIPDAIIYTSPHGEKGLREHYKKNWKFSVVNSNDTISIGKHSFQFLLTPMIHWPDNMVSYCPEEKILFSNDSFGQHISTNERFDDEVGVAIALEEAQKYYGNIVLSYNAQIQKVLETASSLAIDMIAPSHGLIWRSNVKEIVSSYSKWCTNQTVNKALIIYDTMWESTALMADAIREGFDRKDVKVKMLPLKANHMSDIMVDVVDATYICVGSPTLNSQMLPSIAGFLTYLKALSPKKRIAMAFGSYGWGGQSIDQVNEALKQCGFTTWEPIKAKYIPESSRLQEIAEKVACSI